MKRYWLLLAVVSSVFFQTGYCQAPSSQTFISNLIPPAPNASGLGKYADWPVSLYTGVPGVNIPVYSFKGRDISFPVSLSYHGSGIKVGEIASWVGLGWSLDAGGVITRSVRALPDEINPQGYLYFRKNFSIPTDLSIKTNISPATANLYKVGSFLKKYDPEPDLYMFNAMGRSFKFYFGKNDTIITQPYSKVKLSVNWGNDYTAATFSAVLEDGTKLIFGGGSAFCEITSLVSGLNQYVAAANNFASSWYLQKIIGSKGEIVTCTYTSNTVHQDSHISEIDYLKQSSMPPPCDYSMPDKSAELYYSTQDVVQKYPATIENDIAKIIFTTDLTPRNDLPGNYPLKKIEIYSKLESKVIAEYRFNYTYSGLISDQYQTRLKLVSFQELLPGTSTVVKQWGFDYNPTTLPSRKSFVQDYWGYYNGATGNTTTLPPVPGFASPAHATGNRSANPAYTPSETLTKITYPTGGYTKFNYEQNRYQINKEVFADTTIYLSKDLYYNPNDNTTSVTSVFHTTAPQNISLTFRGSYSSTYLMYHNTAMPAVSVTDQYGNIAGFLSRSTSGSASQTIFLSTPGDYTLKLTWGLIGFNPNDPLDNFAKTSLNYLVSHGVQQADKYIGGLRILSIDDVDTVTSKIQTRKFVYESPLLIAPVDSVKGYVSNQTSYVHTGNGDCQYTYQSRSCSSNYALGSIQGGNIGYGKVTTLYGANGENGKTISYFTNYNDEGYALAAKYPYTPVTSVDWRRGLLLRQSDYDANNNLKKEQLENYSFEFKDFISVYKTACKDFDDQGNPGDGAYDAPYVSEPPYELITDIVKKLSTTEKIYNQNNTDSVVTVTNYYYDNPNNLQPVRTETSDSKGNNLKTISRTPLEKIDINTAISLTPTASLAIDSMLARNIISPVIEQEQYRGTSRTSLSLTNYKLNTNNVISPDNIQFQNAANLLETRALFTQYDSYGNILEQQKQNDVKETYIWGYGNQYPVAKILNIDYNTAIQFVNQSVLNNSATTEQQMRTELNNIRAGLQNTNALVTTYTYKPLIGISSQTDPNNRTTYYEYDAFNRLKLIRDQDNNIIKKICYNYAGQVENCIPCTDLSANWQNTSTALRCQLNGSSQNTGYQEQEQKDINSCSSTYNQLRWVSAGYNVSACPLPPQSCSFSMSSGFITPYNTISSTGNTVSFNLVYYSYSTMVLGTEYMVATISSGCRPVTNKTMTLFNNGRSFYVTIYASTGIMGIRMISGTDIPAYTTIGLTSTYDKSL